MSHLRDALIAAGLPVTPPKMRDHLTHEWSAPEGSKRCASCRAIHPLDVFGRHPSYCKYCRRALWHSRYSAKRGRIAA